MACSLMVMTCACVLAGCTTAVPPPHNSPAAAGPDLTTLSFPQLEGVCQQDGRAFVGIASAARAGLKRQKSCVTCRVLLWRQTPRLLYFFVPAVFAPAIDVTASQ